MGEDVYTYTYSPGFAVASGIHAMIVSYDFGRCRKYIDPRDERVLAQEVDLIHGGGIVITSVPIYEFDEYVPMDITDQTMKDWSN